jgi:hypothetical protein
VEVNSKRPSKRHDFALQAVSRRHYEEIRRLKRKLEGSQATVKAQNDTISQLQEENGRRAYEKDFAVSSVMTAAVNLRIVKKKKTFWRKDMLAWWKQTLSLRGSVIVIE